MGNVLKRYNGASWEAVGGTITGDTLPIGSEVDYTGTDIPAGWEEVSDPSVYSTDEKVVGTWINGKPLYRKTIYKTSLSSGNNTYSIGDGTMRVVKLEGIMYQSSNGVVYMLPDVNSSHNVQTEIYITENYTLHINTRRDVSAVNYIAISVYYYKTTD